MRKILEKIDWGKRRGGYKSDFDEFLVAEAMRSGRSKGRLVDFYEIAEHPGWYQFVFNHGGFACTVDCGIQLGIFVENDDGSASLVPELENQLKEKI